ncbi:MAG: TetR/AcrR family transcriptional regulator [Gammaproteobacteria bacterium]|nr:MAG: TetR/AcrR family transcriptional regulator [Gammaproteobacteria bacterium]
MRGKRQGQTSERRQAILDAALACFTEHGFEQTPIEMICERSGASVGSLYHHFGNKEGVGAALFVGGLKAYADVALAGLAERPDAEAGIRWLVTSYIEWVEAHPDLARFIFQSRGKVIRGEASQRLADMNRQQLAGYRDWLQPHMEAGRIRKLPFAVFHALVNGPAQDLVRNWLGGRLKGRPSDWSEVLADAAWRSVRA